MAQPDCGGTKGSHWTHGGVRAVDHLLIMDSDDPIMRRQQRANWPVCVLRGKDAAADESALLPA